ncbi:MAG: MBL fold metallo-hydrolase, partial [Clostridia bacterium]|nr:MBL fold metallo-hydrolase [Clostridia bacterium]
MRITCLVENTSSRSDLEAEHGLSLYIETRQHTILFDMGQTDLFAKNAEKLGIDLKKVDVAILSHGHYDHGGGLVTFLALNSTTSVYVSPYAFEPHYNADGKYIGLDPNLAHHPRLKQTDEVFEIDDNLTLYHCNQCPLTYGQNNDGLTVERNGVRLADDFRHEQYLLIQEEDKTILISGCSHKGIANLTHWFSPQILVGGFHWMKRPLNQELLDSACQLNRQNTVFYTCHCTGKE